MLVFDFLGGKHPFYGVVHLEIRICSIVWEESVNAAESIRLFWFVWTKESILRWSILLTYECPFLAPVQGGPRGWEKRDTWGPGSIIQIETRQTTDTRVFTFQPFEHPQAAAPWNSRPWQGPQSAQDWEENFEFKTEILKYVTMYIQDLPTSPFKQIVLLGGGTSSFLNLEGCVRQTRSWVKNRWNKSSLSAVLSRHVPNCTMFIRNTKRCRDIAWEPECGFLQRHFRGGSWIFAASKLAVWQADSNTLPGVQVRHFIWRCQKNKWKVNVAGTTQPNTLGP